MALLWSNLGMGASTGIHCLSATPNGLAANSLWRIWMVSLRSSPQRTSAHRADEFYFRVRRGAKNKTHPNGRFCHPTPRTDSLQIRFANLYRAAGALPGRKPAAGRFHFIFESGREQKIKPILTDGFYFLATPNGLEPSTSSVTGWRANRLHHRAVFSQNS